MPDEVYQLQKIRMSGNERGQTIYAELVHEDGSLAIMATLEHILITVHNQKLTVEGLTISKETIEGVINATVSLDKYK
jgi:hypothetical protein